MGNVMYLLGAGASAESIPVVNKLSEGIKKDREKFDDFGAPARTRFFSTFTRVRDRLIELQRACDEYHSIDTYAKKLYLTNRAQFQKLKVDLSLFFELHQIMNKPDKRYDNFWASMLQRRYRLPDNVRVMSWNYDSQVETSFANMCGINSLSDARYKLNICSMRSDEVDPGFAVMKLNGTARLQDNALSITYDLCENYYNDPYQSLVEFCEKLEPIFDNQSLTSNLSFAWENDINEKGLSKFLDGYDTLAIIGYSFPFFNREIDKAIFNAGQFRKVYIQDMNPDDIEERLEQIDEGYALRKVKHVGQFVFPNEL